MAKTKFIVTLNDYKNIIKSVAKENNYRIDGSNTNFQVFLKKWHGAHFEIKENSSGYLQVHQWEAHGDDGNGVYGRAIYSIRTTTDLVSFCNILVSSAMIRARMKK